MAGNESLTCRHIQSLITRGEYNRQALTHTQQCEICLQFLLDKVLPSREDASPPAFFTEGILANLPDESRSRSSSRLGLVIAPSLVAVALMGLFFSKLTAPSVSVWGSALLLAFSAQVTFVLLWVAGRTRV
jgi:hypothetical protein